MLGARRPEELEVMGEEDRVTEFASERRSVTASRVLSPRG